MVFICPLPELISINWCRDCFGLLRSLLWSTIEFYYSKVSTRVSAVASLDISYISLTTRLVSEHPFFPPSLSPFDFTLTKLSHKVHKCSLDINFHRYSHSTLESNGGTDISPQPSVCCALSRGRRLFFNLSQFQGRIYIPVKLRFPHVS